MNLLCRKLAQTVDVTILAPSRSRHRVEERLEGVRMIRVPEFGRYASVPLCPTAPFELADSVPTSSICTFRIRWEISPSFSAPRTFRLW